MADIRLENGTIALAHDPSQGLAGLSQPDVKVVVTPTEFKPGSKTKYGNKRCEYKIWLVSSNDKENEGMGQVWIGANPSLGNSLAG